MPGITQKEIERRFGPMFLKVIHRMIKAKIEFITDGNLHALGRFDAYAKALEIFSPSISAADHRRYADSFADMIINEEGKRKALNWWKNFMMKQGTL